MPKLPPKKVIGNTKRNFLDERRYFLDIFLKRLAREEHLINSEEFIMFSKPVGDIDKTLSKMPKRPLIS